MIARTPSTATRFPAGGSGFDRYPNPPIARKKRLLASIKIKKELREKHLVFKVYPCGNPHRETKVSRYNTKMST
jgi:hypothetical protein